MNITIITGTNREGNESQKVSSSTEKMALGRSHTVSKITLENFGALFRGTYMNLENASEEQKEDIQKMISADILIFVVPTYHRGIPSPLKNFLDTIKVPEAYERKIIGVIACTDDGDDHGAWHARDVINGILAHKKLHSFVVPIIPMIDFTNIDEDRIERFIEYCEGFKSS